ncbi:unnamed protein product [Pedinophyceae sp. YPF-701]|nr:unnamed protein product [Pedinophyceae sp. YPF-701]
MIVAPTASARPAAGRVASVKAPSARRVAPARQQARDLRARSSNDPIDTLKAENELIKKTLEEARSSVKVLEQEVGDSVAIAAENLNASDAAPEDIWAPSRSKGPLTPMKDAYGQIEPVPGHDGTECIKWDDTLWSHAGHFRYRWDVYKGVRHGIEANEGGFEKFSRAYEFYGLNRGTHEGKTGLWYREWAPGAKAVALIGEFNNWEPRDTDWAFKNEFGTWELFLPDNPDGTPQVWHRCKVKARVEQCSGAWVDRIPAYIKWATQDDGEILFNGVHWEPSEEGKPGEADPDKKYVFAHPRPEKPRSLRIYECHVGMSSEEPKVNSYTEFRENVLPRIRKLGYNAIQIMAIQEHAYYGSFGYHVTNFFAPSSRCGTPEELKALIDEAHKYGITVLMDIVHSHASKNENDGLSNWDGTDHFYFHSGGRGYHWVWDSRCFNYSNWETLRFLLSNARYWMEEFKFDGFRFDGVTSMLYTHHGLGVGFTGNYDEYFGMATDGDAVVYLMLVNTMVKGLYPNAVTVGEDVSGMPSFCRPWQEGGVGFDYRLNMAAPDMWIETMQTDDWNWGMGHITFTLTNRRYAEAVVGYAESHDQALVGDKTLAFWLMDADMYDYMAAPGFGDSSPAVDRGLALHKMIRMITMCLGGEGYLNFMGNEFGHPEWIDFPRVSFTDPSTGKFVPGNGGSFHLCRRRWDLVDAGYLKYQFFNNWDRAMQHLDKAFGFMTAPHTWISRKDEGDKMVVIERGDLVFVFNFHPVNSYTDYRVGCFHEGPYKMVLSTDEEVFGGFQNVTAANGPEFHTMSGDYDNRPNSFQVYAPSRTCTVYAPAEWVDAKDSVPGLYVKGLGPYPAIP